MSGETEPTVSIEFKVNVGPGSFTAQATVPAGPTNLTAILPVIQSIEDSLTGGICEQLAAEGEPVSCAAGCGACCRQLVPVSLFEAEALSDWMRTLSEEQLQVLERRFARTVSALADAGMLERLEQLDWMNDDAGARQLCIDYLRLHIPCPFLEAESCSIHPIRPLICREYLVISPPERCVDPSTLGAVPVGLPLLFSRVLNAIGAKIDPGSKGWIPLPLLFEWVQKELKPSEAVAGMGPQVLFAFVSHLEEGETPRNKQAGSAEAV